MKHLFAVLILALGLAVPAQAQDECVVVGEEPRTGLEQEPAPAGKTIFGPDDPIALNVVIGYDSDLRVQAEAAGTTVAALFEEAFKWGNEAARASGMRTRVRVFGLQEVPYTGITPAWSSILPWWKNGPGAVMRNSHGAHLALYAMSDSVMGGGGANFFTGSSQQVFSAAAIRADDPDPDDSPRAAGNGKSAFHEALGHTSGLRHSVPTDQPGEGCWWEGDNTCRGYAWYSESLGVRDIMANVQLPSGSDFIQRFSNPEKTYQGEVTGEYGFMEAAQVADENAPTIYNFVVPAGATACLDDGAGLCLLDRFYITVTWQTADGSQGWGVPVQLTDNPTTGKGGGYWWFFNQDNPEVFVKILNACSFSPYYWVFATGLTDVEVHVQVEDTAHFGEVWTMDSVLGVPFPPNTDTNAFATCP